MTNPRNDQTPPVFGGFPAPPYWTAFGADRGQDHMAEGMSAWTGACTAWMDYVLRLSTATGPQALMDANAQLVNDSLQVCSRAAAAHLRAAGVSTPLLTDA